MRFPNLTEAQANAAEPSPSLPAHLDVSAQIEAQLQTVLTLIKQTSANVANGRVDFQVNRDANKVTVDAALSSFPAGYLARYVSDRNEEQAAWILSKYNHVRQVPAQVDPLLSARFTFDIEDGEARFLFMTARDFSVRDPGYGENGAVIGAMRLDDTLKVTAEKLKTWEAKFAAQPAPAAPALK